MRHPHTKPEVAVALDFTKRDLLFSWINQFEGLDITLKIGLGILPEMDFHDFKALKALGFKIFIDAKLHDIPTQVQRSVAKWIEAGADFLTLHCMGGRQMMEMACELEAQSSIRLLGVTVLTSHSDTAVNEIGFKSTVEDSVISLMKLGVSSGLKSFVCSAHEIEKIRAESALMKKDLYLVTPGLVFDENEKRDDQRRVMTVFEAIAKGSNMLVIGRSLIKSKNPRLQIENLFRQMRD